MIVIEKQTGMGSTASCCGRCSFVKGGQASGLATVLGRLGCNIAMRRCKQCALRRLAVCPCGPFRFHRFIALAAVVVFLFFFSSRSCSFAQHVFFAAGLCSLLSPCLSPAVITADPQHHCSGLATRNVPPSTGAPSIRPQAAVGPYVECQDVRRVHCFVSEKCEVVSRAFSKRFLV